MKKIILIIAGLLISSFLMIFFIGQAMAVPTFQATGTAVEGDADTASPTWPAHAVNDIALLFVESVGSEAATLATPNGFAAVANSP